MTAEKPSEYALLPCPFCGESAKDSYIRDGRQVICTGCHANGPPAYHGPPNIPSAIERASDGWNHRHIIEGEGE